MLQKELLPMLDALPFRIVRTRSHDEFRRRADECRRLAASARNARDRAFWLGLVERWQALESQSVPQPTLPSIARGEGQGAVRHSARQSECHSRRFQLML